MDLQRWIADLIIFPYYQSEIRFAALSLDGIGATAYGDCSIVLKDVAISERATAFEENSVLFCEKHELGAAKLLLPPGYRSTWDARGILAVAKLEPKLTPATSAAAFAKLLLGTTDPDFVEVHIYGNLTPGTIEPILHRNP